MRRALVPILIVLSLMLGYGFGTLVGEKVGRDKLTAEAILHGHAISVVSNGKSKLEWTRLPEESNILLEFTREGKIHGVTIYKNGEANGAVASNSPLLGSIWVDGFMAACYTFNMEKSQVITSNKVNPEKVIPRERML